MNLPKPLIAIVAVILIVTFWVVSSYNGLIRLSEQVDTNWAQVEAQYQRRYDLIGNLVEATKGAMTQEREVFSNIAEARQGYAGAQTPDQRAAAAENLESSLARLLVIVENYPELKSNQTVLALMDELAGTENRISVERKRYNEVVRDYNVRIKTIPTSIIAKSTGFEQRVFFESVVAANQAPQIDLTIE